MIQFLYYLLGYNMNEPTNTNIIQKKELNKITINSDELKNIKLKKTIINKKPAFARYAQTNDFNLLKLSQEQLNDILNTKLKHIIPNTKKTYWEPEHPVLNELLKKTKLVI